MGSLGRTSLAEIMYCILFLLFCFLYFFEKSFSKSVTSGQERWRVQRASTDLQVHAFLTEMKGNWLMFKETFHLPGWNTEDGCCWHCLATPDTVLDFSKVTERLNHWDVAMRILDKGAQISPIFECPGFGKDQCLIDWLHAVDHGVACDFIANLWWQALPQIASTRKAAVNQIFAEIKEFYEANHADSKLQTLTEKMIKQEKKPPKLRAKAAEARALVPFAVEFLDVFEKIALCLFLSCMFWMV